jgi:tRNA threonylcarbamoyladenosine biosynthesis protein TsaE
MEQQVTTLDAFKKVMIQTIQKIIDQSPSDQSVIIALSGDLGTGKTTAVQALADYFKITEPVQSPTFVIKKTYPIANHDRFTTLMHTDAYRLIDQSATPLQFDQDFKNPRTICCIEWPEIIQDLLPEHTQWIYIEHTDTGRILRKK